MTESCRKANSDTSPLSARGRVRRLAFFGARTGVTFMNTHSLFGPFCHFAIPRRTSVTLVALFTLVGEVNASNILGRVRGSSHAAVHDAVVMLYGYVSVGTGDRKRLIERRTRVSTDGDFVFMDLVPGRYAIE